MLGIYKKLETTSIAEITQLKKHTTYNTIQNNTFIENKIIHIKQEFINELAVQTTLFKNELDKYKTIIKNNTILKAEYDTAIKTIADTCLGYITAAKKNLRAYNNISSIQPKKKDSILHKLVGILKPHKKSTYLTNSTNTHIPKNKTTTNNVLPKKPSNPNPVYSANPLKTYVLPPPRKHPNNIKPAVTNPITIFNTVPVAAREQTPQLQHQQVQTVAPLQQQPTHQENPPYEKETAVGGSRRKKHLSLIRKNTNKHNRQKFNSRKTNISRKHKLRHSRIEK